MSEWNFYSEHLYQRSSKNVEDLEKNAQEYPFSSVANFLLLFHYKKTAHPDFENFSKKAALHFRNKNWLQFILHQKNGEHEIEFKSEIKTGEKLETHVEQIETEIPIEVDSIDLDKNFNEQNQIEKKAVEEEKIIQDKNEVIKNTEVFINNSRQDFETPLNPVSEILNEQNTYPGNEPSEKVAEIQSPFFTQNIRLRENEISKNTEDLIPFDPLHTVDYFASQGIKLNGDEGVINDKLGNQMKSFTAWLKSMKKLHVIEPTEQSITSENLIQVSAEASNINTEILTEAMAEVLIKQDKKDKAIDMFNKLSLINPAKSAYFAAKIENIKLR